MTYYITIALLVTAMMVGIWYFIDQILKTPKVFDNVISGVAPHKRTNELIDEIRLVFAIAVFFQVLFAGGLARLVVYTIAQVIRGDLP